MTPDPATFLALADRVEREEPSRELDAAIGVACRSLDRILEDFDLSRYVGPIEMGIDERQGAGFVCAWLRQNDGAPRLIHSRPAPHYTTSIDAAVSAMPEGWHVSSIQFSEHWHCEALTNAGRSVHKVRATAPTEPRARMALALRARAAG